VCGGKVVSPQPKTDVLVVRHLDTDSCEAGGGGCPPAPGEVYFQMNSCWDSSSPGYSTTSYVLGTSTFTLSQGSCTSASAGTPAALRKYVSNLYYVRDYAVTAGDGIPTLMRSQFGLSGGVLQYQPAQALIEGIEGFRVELGTDMKNALTGIDVDLAHALEWPSTPRLINPTYRGDGYPDGGNYVHCTTATPCTAAQLANTVAVRLHVLVRAENRTSGYTDTKNYNLGSTTLGPFNDGYKRHVFTQTVRLTNISMRRETPPT
jgi:type IV pilus assembly protein PilW